MPTFLVYTEQQLNCCVFVDTMHALIYLHWASCNLATLTIVAHFGGLNYAVMQVASMQEGWPHFSGLH